MLRTKIRKTYTNNAKMENSSFYGRGKDCAIVFSAGFFFFVVVVVVFLRPKLCINFLSQFARYSYSVGQKSINQ